MHQMRVSAVRLVVGVWDCQYFSKLFPQIVLPSYGLDDVFVTVRGRRERLTQRKLGAVAKETDLRAHDLAQHQRLAIHRVAMDP